MQKRIIQGEQAINPDNVTKRSKRAYIKRRFQREYVLHLMLVLPVAFTLVFNYLPMGGLIMAFQQFKPWLGFTKSPWVGLEHFRTLFNYPQSTQVIWNTVVLSGMKLAANLIAPFLFAIFLNEVRHMLYKRVIQTLVYLPHFLSWVILGGICLDIFALNGGAINQILGLFSVKPIFFLGDNDWFRFTIVVTDVWKEFGFGAIVFLAAIVGVDPSLYEASEVDGANRFQQTMHITIPAMIPITVVVTTLALSKILDAGFDQIFNLYNPLVYEKGDIIDTYVFRTGILQSQFSFSTAVGMFKSVVGLVLVVITYRLAHKFANYRIF